MREQVRKRMRRRSRRGPNNSESTGKVGQELPNVRPGGIAPLRPSYMDATPATEPDELDGPDELDDPDDDVDEPGEVEATQAGRLEVETQPESFNSPPAEAPSVKPRALKGFVVLAIGLPGSGKTTWFKRRGVLPLSSDMLRSILFDDIDEQRYQKLVFSTLRSLLRARLIAKMPWNYVDATNLSPHERRQWIKMAKSFGYDVQAVFFDVPLEVCLERNQRRERGVSEEILRRMAERLRPPHFKEGFSKITLVRVKAKDAPEAV